MDKRNTHNIMKKVLVIPMTLLALLFSCKGGKQQLSEAGAESLLVADEMYDSLIWLQYQCPPDEEETVYQWNWAMETRETLGIEERATLDILCDELDSCYAPLSGGPTCDMIIAARLYFATARFRMLNAYQETAAYNPDSILDDKDFYYQDYALWEKIYEEFDRLYDNMGNGRFLYLSDYYTHLAKLRRDALLIERFSFSADKMPTEEKKTKEPKWDKEHKAIRNWYNYRMSMIKQLQRRNAPLAYYMRHITNDLAIKFYEFQAEVDKEY